MRIRSIIIENYRSIERAEIQTSNFNVFVGQNNHGKTNIFEAVNWFFNGYGRGVSKSQLIFSEATDDADIKVEIVFEGLKEAIENVKNATKKKALEEIFGDRDEINITRCTSYKDGKGRQLLHPESGEWKDIMGADGTWNDLLPYLEYVHTKVNLDDVGGYKSKSPIGEMLSGVLASIIETDPKYLALQETFGQLFGDEEQSAVRIKLDELGTNVEVYLQKQFPDDTSVHFRIDIPEFSDLLKRFSTEVDDGVVTLIEDKGDGMQRAVMLSIIQAYADYRKQNEVKKRFLFMIDEAELHLHPSAQRALKEALLDLSSDDDQVFVNTHSSVLVTDSDEGQSIIRVEKSNKRTCATHISDNNQKMDVIYDLLGGSPADLLLPNNFIIVEGKSEHDFIKTIIKRFYPGQYDGIKILFARGDMKRTDETFHALHEAYKPLLVESGIYKERVVILCDHPNENNRQAHELFTRSHPWINEGEQLFTLPEDALEKYYPTGFSRSDDEIDELEAERSKVSYAVEVASNITQDQFETEMEIVHQAMLKAVELGF